jgi:hypothetical protein
VSILESLVFKLENYEQDDSRLECYDEEQLIRLWLLPAPFDLVEDNWRALCITFLPGTTAAQVAKELYELAEALDAARYAVDPPLFFEEVALPTCSVHFEADLTAEIAALLLYRAAYLVNAGGVPTADDTIVLADPDQVWTRSSYSAGNIT